MGPPPPSPPPLQGHDTLNNNKREEVKKSGVCRCITGSAIYSDQFLSVYFIKHISKQPLSRDTKALVLLVFLSYVLCMLVNEKQRTRSIVKDNLVGGKVGVCAVRARLTGTGTI